MQLIDKATGETTFATEAGAKVLLKRGTHELPAKPKATRAPAKKQAAAAEDTEE